MIFFTNLICRMCVLTIYLCKRSIKPALANTCIPKQLIQSCMPLVKKTVCSGVSLQFNDWVTSHWNKNELFKWGI